MTLTRMILLLFGAMAVMLSAVVLRAESARMHKRLSQLDQTEKKLHAQIAAERLELARWRTPTLIRDKVREFRRAAIATQLETRTKQRSAAGTDRPR